MATEALLLNWLLSMSENIFGREGQVNAKGLTWMCIEMQLAEFQTQGADPKFSRCLMPMKGYCLFTWLFPSVYPLLDDTSETLLHDFAHRTGARRSDKGTKP